MRCLVECCFVKCWNLTFPFHSDLAEQVLDHFRDRFVNVIDANAIVLELEHCGIISNGDQTDIRQKTNPTQQNQLLHACLKKKCTVKALMIVCDIITKVKGNPKLKSLGEDMKTELEKGLSYVGYYACVHYCASWYAICECMHLWKVW